MNQINIKSSSQTYKIFIDENIRFNIKKYIPSSYSSIMIITDENIAPLYLNDVKVNFTKQEVCEVIIPAGEQSKSFQSYYDLQTKAINYGLDRQSLIIALGGGVVGDLAGFVAATFMRGIDYIQIPTTILAHDSSVGGKVAINHEAGKNLIGNFYPPRAVIYDVETLQTLSENEIRSGYAELIKEALIADQYFLTSLFKTNLTFLSSTELKQHLIKGIKIKAHIVERDEKESGERMYLNLGHTLAHAIESAKGYGNITHGEAVAIGLLFSIYMSKQLLFAELPYKDLFIWLKENNYPLSMDSINLTTIIERMKLDKKTINNNIQMVLLKQIGKPTIVEVPDEELYTYLNKFVRELVEE